MNLTCRILDVILERTVFILFFLQCEIDKTLRMQNYPSAHLIAEPELSMLSLSKGIPDNFIGHRLT